MTTSGYHFPSHNLFGQSIRGGAETESVAHLREGTSHFGAPHVHAHASSNYQGGCYAAAPRTYTSAVQRSSPRVTPTERRIPNQNYSPTRIPATRAPPASYAYQTVNHTEVSRAQSSAAAAREAAAYASSFTRATAPAPPPPVEYPRSERFCAPCCHSATVNAHEVNRREVNAYQVNEQRVNICESSARYPRASIGSRYPPGMPQHIQYPEPRNSRPDVDLSALLPGIIPPCQGVAVPEINDVYHRTSVYAASGVPMDMPAFSGDRAWAQRLAD